MATHVEEAILIFVNVGIDKLSYSYLFALSPHQLVTLSTPGGKCIK
jgi:hypothetical protein